RPDGGVSLRVVTVPDFEDAVRAAASIASPGEAVVLSPACTSFDRFANFEERGRLFKQVVISL
ncbi:MAG: UDP-N-acetylmuramoyl-L-alanine--D-glutamate ligase, partial [Clostridia bacterium]|nr:UDP-N-acetylmuramoyl-L-alanine--D-glutamate ligase [Clostridia bacterium]